MYLTLSSVQRPAEHLGHFRTERTLDCNALPARVDNRILCVNFAAGGFYKSDSRCAGVLVVRRNYHSKCAVGQFNIGSNGVERDCLYERSQNEFIVTFALVFEKFEQCVVAVERSAEGSGAAHCNIGTGNSYNFRIERYFVARQ